jgi:hypothetical protein
MSSPMPSSPARAGWQIERLSDIPDLLRLSFDGRSAQPPIHVEVHPPSVTVNPPNVNVGPGSVRVEAPVTIATT